MQSLLEFFATPPMRTVAVGSRLKFSNKYEYIIGKQLDNKVGLFYPANGHMQHRAIDVVDSTNITQSEIKSIVCLNALNTAFIELNGQWLPLLSPPNKLVAGCFLRNRLTGSIYLFADANPSGFTPKIACVSLLSLGHPLPACVRELIAVNDSSNLTLQDMRGVVGDGKYYDILTPQEAGKYISEAK